MSRMPQSRASGNRAQATTNQWPEEQFRPAQQKRKRPVRPAYDHQTDERREVRQGYREQTTQRTMRVDNRADTIRMKPVDPRRDTNSMERMLHRETGRNTLTDLRGIQPNRISKQEARANRLSKVLMYMTVALIVALMFVQIGRLAQISGQTKQMAQLSNAIRELGNERSNLEVRLSMQQNINRVRDEAINKYGMVRPDDGQIRVVALGQSAAVRMQTADVSGVISGAE